MLALNEEERAFGDSVERYLGERYSLRQREAALETGTFSRERWRDFADLGWIASVFDEDSGGFGNAANYAAVLMERLGRYLVVEPLLTTAIICGRLLASRAGQADLVARLVQGDLQLALASGSTAADGFVGSIMEGDGEAFRLSGQSRAVCNAAAADMLIVAARRGEEPVLLLVPASRDGLRIESLRGHDGHNLGNLVLAAVRVEASDVLASGKEAEEALELALDWGTAALCVEAVGSMAALLEATRDHLKSRVQYDRPLADFQVLQHRLADMFIQLETARSIAYAALASLAEPREQSRPLVSAAKIYVFRAANFVGKQAVQLHGGMGVSEELAVAHHFKRLTMAALELGHERRHLRRFIEHSDSAATSNQHVRRDQ